PPARARVAPVARARRSSPGCGRFHPGRARARSRRTPRGSAPACRASRSRYAAIPATWRNAAPTRRAYGSRGRPGCRREGQVATLDGAPGVELLGAVGRLLLGVPADRRRIEQHVGALQRSEACAFGIPLVPAHERPDPSHARVERTEAQVAGREIELLVVGRI